MSQEETQVQDQHGGDAVHTGHPTPTTYFKVAMLLAALTAVEVAIFYVTPLSYAIIRYWPCSPSANSASWCSTTCT